MKKNTIPTTLLCLLFFTTIAYAVNMPPIDPDFVNDCLAKGGTIEYVIPEQPEDVNNTDPQGDYPTIGRYVCVIPETTRIVRRCSDRTRYSRCSETQPLYCKRGELVPDCEECGCPDDLECAGDECVEAEEPTTSTIAAPTTIEETTSTIQPTRSTVEPTTTVKPATTTLEPTTSLIPPTTTVEAAESPTHPPTGRVVGGESGLGKNTGLLLAGALVLIAAAIVLAAKRR